jgi:hypothetical protein
VDSDRRDCFPMYLRDRVSPSGLFVYCQSIPASGPMYFRHSPLAPTGVIDKLGGCSLVRICPPIVRAVCFREICRADKVSPISPAFRPTAVHHYIRLCVTPSQQSRIYPFPEDLAPTALLTYSSSHTPEFRFSELPRPEILLRGLPGQGSD